MVLAEEWQLRITNGQVRSRAELARELGFSRARVTQALRILSLSPRVKEIVRSLGDPMDRKYVSERMLLSICKLPAEEQERKILEIINWPVQKTHPGGG